MSSTGSGRTEMLACFEMVRLRVEVVRFGMKCDPLTALMADTLDRLMRVEPIIV